LRVSSLITVKATELYIWRLFAQKHFAAEELVVTRQFGRCDSDVLPVIYAKLFLHPLVIKLEMKTEYGVFTQA
jgi:hypothetical protein